MAYGAVATWAFLATWHTEYLEGAEASLARDARGAVHLPSPAGPLEAAAVAAHKTEAAEKKRALGSGSSGGGGGDVGTSGYGSGSGYRAGGGTGSRSRSGPGSTRRTPASRLLPKPVGAHPPAFILQEMEDNGGGNAWAECEGWAWLPLESAASLLGSPMLDGMLAGIWQGARKGNVSHIDRVLKIEERRAKLLGLDAPTKVAETDPEGNAAGPREILLVSPGDKRPT